MEVCHKALEIKPDMHEAWHNLAATYQHRSSNPSDPQARLCFRIENAILAAALQKTTPEQDFLLAREVWGAHGRWVEAKACIDRVLEMDLVGLAALCYAAEIAINLGEFDAAEAFIDRVSRLEPDHPEALYPLARLLKQRGQNSDARTALRDYYDYFGAKLEYRKQMETARLFRELDDADYAEQACIGAQIEDGEAWEPELLRAQIQWKDRNDPLAAAEILEKLIAKRYGQHPAVYLSDAELALESGDFRRCRERLDGAKAHPDFAALLSEEKALWETVDRRCLG